MKNTTQSPSFWDDAVRERRSEITPKLQILFVGSLVLGVLEDEIATISEWRRPSPLPHAPPAVLGVVSIQGRMLTVLDPLHLFDETTTRLGFPSGILVALRGDEQLALAIERKGDTIDLPTNDIQTTSSLADKPVTGIFHHGDQIVNVIQTNALFSAALRGRERRRRRLIGIARPH